VVEIQTLPKKNLFRNIMIFSQKTIKHSLK
jgi:hypothetical protein